MSRSRFEPTGGGQPNHKKTVRDRLDQAQNARLAQLKLHRKALTQRAAVAEAEVVRKAAQPQRDAARYLKTLQSVPFWMSGEQGPFQLSKPYLELVRIAAASMNDESRHAVLCWPNFHPSPASIAALLNLADNGSTDPTEDGGLASVAAPIGVRALVYPYARTVHRGLRHVYPDAAQLGKLHTLHQVRTTARNDNEALADYHKTVARVKTLNGVALDGRSYEEFRHPCLDELTPAGPCIGEDGRSELLSRVRTKTDLSKISRSGRADDPQAARFYLFGLRATDDVAQGLKRVHRDLDLIVCDLTAVGRNRLGSEWQQRMRNFLATVDRDVGRIATVAITDDPWTFDILRFDTLSRGPKSRERRRPEPSTVLLSHASDIVTQRDEQDVSYKGLTKAEAFGFSGEVADIIEGLRVSARRAGDLGDNEAVDILRRLQGTVRRCASLPGSHRQFSDYLLSQIGDSAVADIMTAYRVGALTKELQQSQGAWSQHDRSELERLVDAVARIWEHTSQLTPMAPLLLDVVRRFKGVSSRTAILFRNDMMADFASHVACADAEIGEAITSRIEKDMIMFVDAGGLDDLSSLPAKSRNHIKTLVTVAPTRAQILTLIAKPWLPDNFIILADSDTLVAASRDAKRLGRYPELSVISNRFTLFDAAASAAIVRSGLRQDAEESVQEDVEFPTSSVVNLAGNLKPGQPAVRLELSGGQVLIAKPGTKLILQDEFRILPTFIETDAKDVDQGDRVCVIGDAFIEMARPILNITVRAAEEIRDYHSTVIDRFARIPGATHSARLDAVVSAMNMPGVTIQRASYWVDLKEQFDAALHDVVPHAPRDRATFLSFMKVLGVSEPVAQRYWTWAIIAQRASRLRAAMSFHDAYRTILVDNYAAQSANPERSREIRRLKAAAEDFVSVVRTKSIERGELERA
jgi:hypothetical protein